MATITLSERRRPNLPINALSKLFPRVCQGRAGYLHLIGRLPPPLKELAQKHYDARLRRTNGQPLLGELAPWLIADLLDCASNKKVEEITVAWLHIYFSVMLLDDLIDSPAGLATSEHLILVSLLQQRGVSRLIAMSPSPERLQQTIDTAFTNTAEAASRELTRRTRGFGSFQRREVNLLGEKLALVRICVKAISESAEVLPHRQDWVERVFDDLLIALQLLDDITDWEEDYMAGNVTFPLSLAYQHSTAFSKSDKRRRQDSAQITLFDLIESKALEITIQHTLSFLRKARIELNHNMSQSESVCCSYVALLISTGEGVLETLRKARQEILPFTETRRKQKSIRTLTPSEQRIVAAVVLRVKKSLVTVAQSS